LCKIHRVAGLKSMKNHIFFNFLLSKMCSSAPVRVGQKMKHVDLAQHFLLLAVTYLSRRSAGTLVAIWGILKTRFEILVSRRNRNCK
jgi:hypothetical protein